MDTTEWKIRSIKMTIGSFTCDPRLLLNLDGIRWVGATPKTRKLTKQEK